MSILKFKSEEISNLSEFKNVHLELEKTDNTSQIKPNEVRKIDFNCVEVEIPDSDLKKLLDTKKVFLKTEQAKLQLNFEQFEDGNYVKNANEHSFNEIENSLNKTNVTTQDCDTYSYDGDLRYWMDAMYYKLKDKLLTEVAIPGTHNSGVFSWKNTIGYRCQCKDINEQLHMGVRAFDIRLKKSGSNYYMHHNGAYCQEQSLEHMINSVKQYLRDFLKEVIIIDLTKGDGSNLTDDDYKFIKQKLVHELGSYLYPSNLKNLSELKFGDLVESNQRLVIITENISLGTPDENLFWKNSLVHNTWTSDQQNWTYTVGKKMDLLKKHIQDELAIWSARRDCFVIYSFNIWSINIRLTSKTWEDYHLNAYFDGTVRAGIRIAVFDFIEDHIVRGVIACNE